MVLAPITFVELLESFTWILNTIKAIFSLTLCEEFAVLDYAFSAVLALLTIVKATSGAMIFLTLMCHA